MRYMIDLFAQLLTMVSVNKNTACFHFNIFSFSRSHLVLVEISNTSSIYRSWQSSTFGSKVLFFSRV